MKITLKVKRKFEILCILDIFICVTGLTFCCLAKTLPVIDRLILSPWANKICFIIFFRNQGGEMLYARCVGLADNVAYPLKQGHIQEKQKAVNQRP